MNIFRKGFLIFVCALSMIASGCYFDGKPHDVRQLAQALKKEGIRYTTIKSPKKKGASCPNIKVDQEVSLEGYGVSIAILRLSERESFERLNRLLGIALAMFEMRSPKGSAKALIKSPFVVIVLQEPAPDAVRNALERIFPSAIVNEARATEEGYQYVEQLKAKLKEMLGQLVK